MIAKCKLLFLIVGILLLSGCGTEKEEKQMHAYYTLLGEIMETEVVDGVDLRLPVFDDIHESEFLFCDVDGDGSKELLLLLRISVQPYTCIFDYDAKMDEVYLEARTAPIEEVRFFDNGIMELDFDHNQGVGPEDWSIFYPYEVQVYDWRSDSYLRWSAVDAWDKKSNPTDHNGIPFPDEVDLDGDGIIYQVGTEYFKEQEKRIWNETHRGSMNALFEVLGRISLQDNAEYVDRDGFDAWVQSYRANAKEIELPDPMKLVSQNLH